MSMIMAHTLNETELNQLAAQLNRKLQSAIRFETESNAQEARQKLGLTGEIVSVGSFVYLIE